jgi:signal transduction histidine kinase
LLKFAVDEANLTAGIFDPRRLLTLPHLTPDLERNFQAAYYATIRNSLRVVAALLAALTVFNAARDYLDTYSASYVVSYSGPTIAFYLLICGLATFDKEFRRRWQPVLVASCWAAMAFSLEALAAQLAEATNGPFGEAASPVVASFIRREFFTQRVIVLMICLAAFRLQFRWSLLLQAGVVTIGVWALAAHLSSNYIGAPYEVWRFLQTTLLVLFVVQVISFIQERLFRHAFLAHHRLSISEAEEHRRRVRSERMLHVLGQAIGGIVHDLGNPLTAVQTGAETLRHFVREKQTDPEILEEFAEIITDGARMLNYLRLSLIEQARVLEGKPTPVELKPVSLRPIIEAGARYQKPRLVGNREIVIEGDEVQICADEMKMVTVFMNLIGNALKYSDGEVRITWRETESTLLAAVLDQGTAGRGISRAQAGQLFTAFARLETHAAIEGTGLGLLSVQKVMEAHGGEAFIEGYTDGIPTSPPFTTARGTYPSMLTDGFRTAFVVTCPLAAASQPRTLPVS